MPTGPKRFGFDENVLAMLGRNLRAPQNRICTLPPPGKLFAPGPHRLVAQDTTLSRWRHGFESRWGCQNTCKARTPSERELVHKVGADLWIGSLHSIFDKR